MNLDSLPTPSEKRLAIHVTKAAERALRGGHPWLFADSIRKQSGEGQAGDLAVIFDGKRRFLAIGFYDPESPIRVRVLQHHQQATIDRLWFTEKLRAAVKIREPLLATDTNGYRLVHGENDGLPGLVVDRYADTLVVKVYTSAWLPHLRDIIAGLEVVQPHERIVFRASRNIDAFPLDDSASQTVIFRENGLRFAANVVQGHKTGFFFDQRENRARVRALAAGRRVLDVFAYSGGFSVYAAGGGETHITSMDISAPALDAAAENLKLNDFRVDHRPLVGDAFTGLDDLHQAGERFDMVIVDPPSFAKNSAEINRALAAYARLTRLAVNVLEPGGVLMMASCSSHVTAPDFFETVLSSARLDEIERTGHALDHPIGFPEGAYLKCLFATYRRE